MNYIIMQKFWEYNDEYHYMNSDGGEPQLAYKDKEKAEVDALARNIEVLKGRDILGYLGESFQDYLEIPIEDFKNMIVSMGGKSDDDSLEIPNKLSIEDGKKILAVLTARWFYVTPVKCV